MADEFALLKNVFGVEDTASKSVVRDSLKAAFPEVMVAEGVNEDGTITITNRYQQDHEIIGQAAFERAYPPERVAAASRGVPNLSELIVEATVLNCIVSFQQYGSSIELMVLWGCQPHREAVRRSISLGRQAFGSLDLLALELNRALERPRCQRRNQEERAAEFHSRKP
jgi:hypothetical protein